MRWATGIVFGVLILAGCGGPPSYAGGPTEGQPYSLIVTGADVSVWKVDGWDTYTRTGESYVEPGARSLWLRVQNPIEHEGEPHRWVKAYKVRVEEGRAYLLYRGESDFPPWPVVFEELGE